MDGASLSKSDDSGFCCCSNGSRLDDAVCAGMDLDDSAQWPLHWGSVIVSEEDDGPFSNVVTPLAPFVAYVQLIEILSMPAAPEVLLELLNMLPAG